MEVYPSLAFDSLFENSGSQRNSSILDRVSSEAATLRWRSNGTFTAPMVIRVPIAVAAHSRLAARNWHPTTLQ
mgnify:CR=1 FL=1